MNWWQRFKKSSAHTQANIVCTILIMVATIAYSIVAGLQLHEIKRTNDLTQTALNGSSTALSQTLAKMQGQIDAMNKQFPEIQRSSTAAQTSAKNAHADFIRDERAWMGVSFGQGNISLADGQPFSVPLTFINTGKTPAKNVEGWIVVGIFDNGERLDFKYRHGHAHYRIHGGTIFPNGPMTESFQGIKHGKKHAEPILITPSNRENVSSGRAFLIIHGKIAYTDIFGIKHWTTFCRFANQPSLISEECTRYNDTDDN
jgi:hypothetical protein